MQNTIKRNFKAFTEKKTLNKDYYYEYRCEMSKWKIIFVTSINKTKNKQTNNIKQNNNKLNMNRK